MNKKGVQLNTGRTHFKKGHTPTNKGHFDLFCDNGYWRIDHKYLHRMIMEKHIGRKLKNTEIVHHINEDRKDNRINNLEILTRASHCGLHKPALRRK